MKIIQSIFLFLISSSLSCSQAQLKTVQSDALSRLYEERYELEQSRRKLQCELLATVAAWYCAGWNNNQLKIFKKISKQIEHDENEIVVTVGIASDYIGCLLARKISPTCACLDILCVIPEKQNQGFGTRMLQDFILSFFESEPHHTTICLMLGHPTQLPFFKKHGFLFDMVEGRWTGSITREAYFQQLKGPSIRDVWNNY